MFLSVYREYSNQAKNEMNGNHNEIKKSQIKDITNIPKEELNSLRELSGNQILKVRFAWIARKPDTEMAHRVQGEVVGCFMSTDALAVSMETKNAFSIEATEGFISAKDIPRIKQEWSKTEQPLRRPNTQYGCVIAVNHRFITPLIAEELEQLGENLKEITRNKHFKFAMIVW